MGPISLFDKSFLQSLSTDESVWFDHFFLPVVCPIFFVETLSDLAKAPEGDRSAQAQVRTIASKFPEMSGSPCANHIDLGVSNLLGAKIPMDGRIPRSGGRFVKEGGRSGIVYDQSPEDAAFQRWQQERFHEVERVFAANWRAALYDTDLKVVAKTMQDLGIDSRTCNSLDTAKRISDGIVNGTSQPYQRLGMAVRFFDIPHRMHPPLISRWISAGQPPLAAFAPYAAYVLTIEIFFQLCLAANLISPERVSNRTDLAYLYYLPFCMVFISSDRLHRRVGPLFLRDDQEFIWGIDLKADLKRMNAHYLTFSQDQRDQGIMKFARRPPGDQGFFITELWKRHMRQGVLEESKPAPDRDPAKDRRLVKELKSFVKGPGIPRSQGPMSEDDIDSMAIERRVSKKKGSWWQLPKDLPEQDDN